VVDRFVGGLSFGIYLTHYPIYLLLAQHLEPRLTGALTAVLAILAAIVLYLLVDRPLDRWRQARARARRAGHPASGVTAESLAR
jgi:peptidoglycan/LPS O-acetylase OafA/YrhL